MSDKGGGNTNDLFLPGLCVIVTTMHRDLPSLQAMKALEAAVRWQSFSQAAKELHLTHGAISRQIRQLENALGRPLFYRQGNAMRPTEAARSLAQSVRTHLAALSAAFAAARPDAAGAPVTLVVNLMADLAANWLVPRLAQWQALHPGIELKLKTHSELATPDPHDSDIGIWYQRCHVPGYRSLRLPEDDIIAVCAPALLARHPDADWRTIRNLPLLRFSRRGWHDWFEAAGLPTDEPERGPVFEDAALLLQAALSGQGVALSRRNLTRDYLASGALCQLGPVSVPVSFDFYICWRHDHPEQHAIRLFHRWLERTLRGQAEP